MLRKPKALVLIRPAILAGGLTALAGAAVFRGVLDIPDARFWGVIVMATGAALLLFGLLASAAWRAVVKADAALSKTE